MKLLLPELGRGGNMGLCIAALRGHDAGETNGGGEMSVTTSSGYAGGIITGADVNPGETVVVTGTVVGGSLFGSFADFGGSLDNQGLILDAGSANQAVFGTLANITNSGTIIGSHLGLLLEASTLANSGTIISEGSSSVFPVAVVSEGYSAVNNSGVIIGGVGFNLQSPETSSSQLVNTGVIYGFAGVLNAAQQTGPSWAYYPSNTGTIINYGTILGTYSHAPVVLEGMGNAATLGGLVSVSSGEAVILALGTNELTLLHGVTIDGLILTNLGSSELTLAGSAGTAADPVTLWGNSANVAVTIDNSSPWVLQVEGTVMPAFTGFGAADTLVLDGFSATSAVELPGVGVILNSASGPDYISLPNSYGSAATFYVHGASTGTGIAVSPAAFGGGNLPQAPIYHSGTVLMGSSGSTGGLLQNGGTGGTALTVSLGQGVGIEAGAALVGGTGGTGGAGLRAPTIATYDYPPPPPNTAYFPGGAGGSGGAGLYLSGGAVLNAGTIEGGNGGAPGYLATQTLGPGGVGVLIQSGLLINAGTISGRDGAAAVSFTGAGTLEVEPDAVFNGIVTATSADELILINPGSIMLGEVGTLFQGFGTVEVIGAAPCFCAGSRIRTPGGEVAVEDLRIGDLVETAFNGAQRIKWIGRREYDGRFLTGNHLALPVCLKAGAIADKIPSRDLWVSPDHAICEGGVLVHAWRLLNGVSIIQPQEAGLVRYFHLEFEEHQVVFAEDCPAESFADAACRARFQNADEFYALYGEGNGAGRQCLPRLQGGFHLHNIQRRIAARAGVVPETLPPGPLRGNLDEAGSGRLHGWAQDERAPEEPVMLDIFAGANNLGRVLANEYRADLRAAGLGSGCHAFTLTLPQGWQGGLDIRRVSDGVALFLPPAVCAA